MRRIKRLLVNVLLFFAVSLICLVLLELTLSIIQSSKNLRNDLEVREHYKQLYEVSSNSDVSFEHAPNLDMRVGSVKGRYNMHVITNAEGLREDKNIPFEKRKGIYRIIGLGDSIVFGASVDNNETFLKIIESLNDKIETLNFGVGSYNTRNEYYYLEYKKAADYSPNLILLGFCLNDFDNGINRFNESSGKWYYEERSNVNEKRTYNSVVYKIAELCAKSRVIKFIYDLVGVVAPSFDYDPGINEIDINETTFWISKIKEYAEKHNIKFVMVIFPTKRQLKIGKGDSGQESALKICSELNIKCLDLLDKLYKYRKENKIDIDDFYWDVAHPYKEGYKAIGQIVYQWIDQEDLI